MGQLLIKLPHYGHSFYAHFSLPLSSFFSFSNLSVSPIFSTWHWKHPKTAWPSNTCRFVVILFFFYYFFIVDAPLLVDTFCMYLLLSVLPFNMRLAYVCARGKIGVTFSWTKSIFSLFFLAVVLFRLQGRLLKVGVFLGADGLLVDMWTEPSSKHKCFIQYDSLSLRKK